MILYSNIIKTTFVKENFIRNLLCFLNWNNLLHLDLLEHCV